MRTEMMNFIQGKKQRVLIGRTLIGNPSLLIFDEPKNGLDFIAREHLLESIEKISEYTGASTMIYVTYHVEEILPVLLSIMINLKN